MCGFASKFARAQGIIAIWHFSNITKTKSQVKYLRSDRFSLSGLHFIISRFDRGVSFMDSQYPFQSIFFTLFCSCNSFSAIRFHRYSGILNIFIVLSKVRRVNGLFPRNSSPWKYGISSYQTLAVSPHEGRLNWSYQRSIRSTEFVYKLDFHQ